MRAVTATASEFLSNAALVGFVALGALGVLETGEFEAADDTSTMPDSVAAFKALVSSEVIPSAFAIDGTLALVLLSDSLKFLDFVTWTPSHFGSSSGTCLGLEAPGAHTPGTESVVPPCVDVRVVRLGGFEFSGIAPLDFLDTPGGAFDVCVMTEATFELVYKVVFGVKDGAFDFRGETPTFVVTKVFVSVA